MTFHLLQLENTPIFEQLQLEEALLRADDRNWIITNRGSPPAIVMGISGKPDQLLHRQPFPLIKRFSGGGTVVVDQNTLFVTLIGNKETLPFTPFPEPLMRWTEQFYTPLGISLLDNDYVIGDRKCGGNAQYIQKGRWLHHTSFLWDYNPEHMSCLKIPPKQPAYRANRPHTDFLTPLKDHFTDTAVFLQCVVQQLALELTVVDISLDEARPLLARSHRKSTHIVH